MGDTTVQPGTHPNTQPQGDPAGNQPGKAQDTGNGKPDNTKGEPLGEAGLAALQEERAARKAETEARKALEKRIDALKPFEALAQQLGNGDAAKGKSEIEQLGERHAQLEKEIREERDARWRAELAHEHGLTAKQASRLRGATRDEMVADAKDLVADFEIQAKQDAEKRPGRPKPDRSQGGGTGQSGASGKDAGMAEARRRGFIKDK
jgi:hypothetical protein